MTTRKILLATALGATLATPLSADDNERVRPVTDPLTRAECSACHMAYPVGLLRSQSWERIMGTLSDHFGEDASLDPASTEAIRAWLVNNSRPYTKPPAEPPMRISELKWFKREHGSRLFTVARVSKGIGSISNCQACHRGAEQGRFEDD